MRKSRVGKQMLLREEKWIEFDTFPAGKKLSLSVWDIAGVTEGPKGEAIILVNHESGRAPVQLLNLYGPALRDILLLRGSDNRLPYVSGHSGWEDSIPLVDPPSE